MNIWEVVFEVSWSYMDFGEFDEDKFETVSVAASDYDSALETAKAEIALLIVDNDEDENKPHYVRDARLMKIERGIAIDAIAKVKA